MLEETSFKKTLIFSLLLIWGKNLEIFEVLDTLLWIYDMSSNNNTCDINM